MAKDSASGGGRDRSPWAAVAAIGGLLGGVAAIAGVLLERDGQPSSPAPAAASTSSGPTPTTGPVPDPPPPAPDPGPGPGPVDDDVTPSPDAAVVPVGDVLDLDRDGSPDLAWDGSTVTWVDSRVAAAPPGPTEERCREALARVPAGVEWTSTVGTTTPPPQDCVETSRGTVALSRLAVDAGTGGLAVTWTAWG